MQDEVNTKVVAIAIKGGRITAEVLKKALAKALKKFVEEIEKAQKTASQPKTYRGKQSIKHLVEQNAAISNIEVTDGNIKSFERTANKYGIDYALKKGKGYAGRCAGDTFYVQLMLMLKYATKNSDVLGGCWQYTPQTAVTKAETGVKRVIIATSYANNFDVGSTVNVGTDKERNNAGNYSAARARTILSKTAIDDSNTALNLDGTPITTTTACFVSSMPWKTGATDKLLGTDGRPSAAFAANHQPIRLQGIELFNGIYESDADLIANAVKDNDNLGRIELYRVFDITKASKTSTANYTKIGEFAARDKTTNDSWRYAEDFTLSNGVIIPTGLNATSTTGMCDAIGAMYPAGEGRPGELLTNARQADAVSRALASVRSARSALRIGMTPDVVLTEVEQAQTALGELTGRTAREDMVARIFERFCVGK